MRYPTVATTAKLLCGVSLVGWLLWQAAGEATLSRLRDDPPDIGWLAAAWAAIVAALALAFVRWWLVAAAAGVTMRLAEALRLGALGFACNFVALGNVGGDVVKATLLARPRPGQRGAAVTTVVVDRLLGLLGFLLYAAAAILWTGAAEGEPTPLRLLSRSTLIATTIAVAGYGLLLAPGRLLERLASVLASVPMIGSFGVWAGELAATYRAGRPQMLAALGVGLLVNGVFILSFYAAAVALGLPVPTLAQHFFAVPLAVISGAAPISPNGLGTIEATTELLYRTLRPDAPVGTGTLAALAHRLAMVTAGVTGVAYYYAAGGRRFDAAINDPSTINPSVAGSGTASDGS